MNLLTSFIKNKKVKYHSGLIFTLLLSVLSVITLLHSGLFPTHDGEYHVVRFFEFDKTLRSGSLYPIWAPDLNYTFGSPLFNYVYPLPNYLSSLFHLFGLSFIDTFKFNLFTATIVGSIGAYLYGRSRFSDWGGILVSAFYTYAPYHFLDIYIRGSVGEVWALSFFPYSLWTFDRIAKKNSAVSISIAALIYSLVIFSHNILAVMFSGFLIFYVLLISYKSKKPKKTFLASGSSIILGILLTSVFIFPALLEEKYVVGLKVFDVTQNFPELFQLLIPSWGSGFSGGDLSNQMSFQIGIANLLVILFICLGFIKKKRIMLFEGFLLICFFLIFFLITPYSAFLWRNIPFLGFFQFPWRLLSLEIFICAILAGSLTTIYNSKVFYIGLLFFLLLSTFTYAKPAYYMDRNDEFYMKNPNFIYSTNSIGNVFQTKWLPLQKTLPKINKSNSVKLIEKNAVEQKFEISLEKDKQITFNTAYFPGWKGYMGSKKIQVTESLGKISVHLPKGGYLFTLRLEDTIVRLIAKLVSAAAILIILLLAKDSVLQYFYERRN